MALYEIPLDQIKPGDTLIPDGDFTCMVEGQPRRVQRDSWLHRMLPERLLTWLGVFPSLRAPGGDLYVHCADGRHYLDGNLRNSAHGTGPVIIGFVKSTVPNQPEALYGETYGTGEYELVGRTAILLAEAENFPAGTRMIVMGVTEDTFHLMDEEGEVIVASKAAVTVLNE